jgi:hypothetical protein
LASLVLAGFAHAQQLDTSVDAGAEILSPLSDGGDSTDAGSLVDAGVAEVRVDLSDATAPLDLKRAWLGTVTGAALDDALARVQPAAARATLCREWLGRATSTLVRVESVNADGDPVVARVFIDGLEVGEAPVEARVATCSQTMEVVHEDQRRSETLSLTAVRKVIRVDWGGTPKRWSLSPILDLTVFDPPTLLVPPGNTPAVGVIGTGLRLEKWSTLFHGSLAITANPLYGPLVGQLTGSVLAVVPNIDLFGGVNFRPGNHTVRALISGQLGLWQLVHPAARATFGAMFLDRLLVTVSADARMMLVTLIVPSFTQYFPSLFVFGASAAVGVCW